MVSIEDRVVSGAQAFARFTGWFGSKLAISALKGFYMPLFATTALKQFRMEPAAEDARYAANDRVNAQQFFDRLSWSGGRSIGLVGHFFAANEAFQRGNGEWYLTALAVTNAADYLINAYSRSKNRGI